MKNDKFNVYNFLVKGNLKMKIAVAGTGYVGHKHSGTSHRLAMTIQAVPAAACQIPIVRGISLITNIAKPPNRFSARKMKFPTQE